MSRKWIIFWMFVSWAFSPVIAQSFKCDGSFYIILRENGTSALYNLQVNASGDVRPQQLQLSEPDRRYTCLGMSIVDMYLYALDFDTKELLRIDAGGLVTSLGVPEHLNTDFDYWAGDMAAGGNRLMVIGRDKNTGVDKEVYSINLRIPDHYAGSSAVISSFPTAISDIATDPVRGVMYGYDKTNRQVVVIGISKISHHLHKKVEPVMEALFFDREGNLYGYGSQSSGDNSSTLFSIDKLKGGIIGYSSHVKGSMVDGCSCPYTISFTRSIFPSDPIPCNEFIIQYVILNRAGIGKTGATLSDTLPSYVSILEIMDHSYDLAKVESGEGTNKLIISNMDILLNENIIRLKVLLLPTTLNTFTTQAILQGLPLGLDTLIYSDDPATIQPNDPNRTIVKKMDNPQILITYNCSQGSAVLGLPFRADVYEWSNGVKEESITITNAGTYWVKAHNSCTAMEDTVFLEALPEPLSLKMPDDMELDQGRVITLTPEISVFSGMQLYWSSTGIFDLSCTHCLQPSLSAGTSQTYTLSVKDKFGCEISDSVRIGVIPIKKVYASTAFSPNGDGINDIFFLQGADKLALVEQLRIFDRWGNEVFTVRQNRLNDTGWGWDGNHGGEWCFQGLYIWVAQLVFSDGQKQKISGEVLLVRN